MDLPTFLEAVPFLIPVAVSSRHHHRRRGQCVPLDGKDDKEAEDAGKERLKGKEKEREEEEKQYNHSIKRIVCPGHHREALRRLKRRREEGSERKGDKSTSSSTASATLPTAASSLVPSYIFPQHVISIEPHISHDDGYLNSNEISTDSLQFPSAGAAFFVRSKPSASTTSTATAILRTEGSGDGGGIESDPSLFTIRAALLPSHPLSDPNVSIDSTTNASTNATDNKLDNHLLYLWFGTQTKSNSDNLENDKIDDVEDDVEDDGDIGLFCVNHLQIRQVQVELMEPSQSSSSDSTSTINDKSKRNPKPSNLTIQFDSCTLRIFSDPYATPPPSDQQQQQFLHSVYDLFQRFLSPSRRTPTNHTNQNQNQSPNDAAHETDILDAEFFSDYLAQLSVAHPHRKDAAASSISSPTTTDHPRRQRCRPSTSGDDEIQAADRPRMKRKVRAYEASWDALQSIHESFVYGGGISDNEDDVARCMTICAKEWSASYSCANDRFRTDADADAMLCNDDRMKFTDSTKKRKHDEIESHFEHEDEDEEDEEEEELELIQQKMEDTMMKLFPPPRSRTASRSGGGGGMGTGGTNSMMSPLSLSPMKNHSPYHHHASPLMSPFTAASGSVTTNGDKDHARDMNDLKQTLADCMKKQREAVLHKHLLAFLPNR